MFLQKKRRFFIRYMEYPFKLKVKNVWLPNTETNFTFRTNNKIVTDILFRSILGSGTTLVAAKLLEENL